MKLSAKLITGFIIVSTVPLLLMSLLLYLFVSSNTEELYLKKSDVAVLSFRTHLEDQFAQLEKNANELAQDKDFLIDVLDLPGRQSDLTDLLEKQVAAGEYQFAIIRLSKTGAMFKAYENDLADLIERYRQRQGDTSNLSSVAGLLRLSADRDNSIAAIASVPVFYRNEVVGELMIGRMLTSIAGNYRLALSGLSALLVTSGNKVLSLNVIDSSLVPSVTQLASTESDQNVWQASVGDYEYFVRQTDIMGLEGKPIAAIKYVFDQREQSANKARLVRIFALLALSAIAISLLLGYFYSRSIARPVGEMSAAARKIAAGEAPERILYFADDEIADLASGINRLAADLKETEVKLRRSEQVAAWQLFARQTAHEIRNFLMPISTTIVQLQRWTDAGEVDRARIVETVRSIQVEIMRMKHLLAAFSDFAKLPAPTFKTSTLETIIGDLKSAFSEQADQGMLHVKSANEQFALRCDSDQIGQVLFNLVRNSFEARATIVEVTVTAGDSRVTFEVVDDGEGIKSASGIDPFTPLYTTRARGSGLGLAICRRIIADHGGDIVYSANPTGGTVFSFYLPRGNA